MASKTNPAEPSVGSSSKPAGAQPSTASTTATTNGTSGRRRSSSKLQSKNPDLHLEAIGNYIFHKTIGEGNFACVKLATHKLTGQQVAVKVIDKTTYDQKKLSKLYREVRIMKLLHHQNIVSLYEVLETKNTVFLVMEYSSGGELYDYLVAHGKMREKEARAKFRQIVSAVNYCHQRKIIHRDLKAENLLLDENFNVKIADFGFGNYYGAEKLNTFCGSAPYASPELFQGIVYTGPEVDMWSLGVILYVMTTGCLPFSGKTTYEIKNNVCAGKYLMPKDMLSEACQRLIRKFIVRDPNKRHDLSVVADDPWLNEGYKEAPIAAKAPEPDRNEKKEWDNEILKFIEEKYKITKATMMPSLEGELFDDNAALYFLTQSERQKDGLKPVDPTQPVDGGDSGNFNIDIMAAQNVIVSIDESPSEEVNEESKYLAEQASRRKSSTKTEESKKTSPVTNPPAKPTVPPPAATTKPPDNKPTADDAQFQKSRTRNRRYTLATEDEQSILAKIKESNNANNAIVVSAGPGNSPGKTSPPNSNTKSTDPSRKPDATAAAAATNVEAESETVGPDGKKRNKRRNTLLDIFRFLDPAKDKQGGPGGNKEASDSATATTATGTASGSAASSSFSGTGSDEKPRAVRFTFSSITTSSKPPDVIADEIISTLSQLSVSFERPSKFLFICRYKYPEDNSSLKMEIEICRLPRFTDVHGLMFKRLHGSSEAYKTECEKILNSVRL